LLRSSRRLAPLIALCLTLVGLAAAHAAPPTPDLSAPVSLRIPVPAPRPGIPDLELAVGRLLARDGANQVSLAAQLRLGARDGVNVTAGYGYLLPREALSGRPLGPHGAISIPLGPRLALTGEGSLFGDGGGLATLGLSFAQRSAGVSWFLTAGLGFTVERADGACGGGGRMRVNADWCAAPAAVIGFSGRF
jgi:hypothetical protein